MGYAEKRGSGASIYYIARFSDGRGRWPTVKDDAGRALRYRTKRAAEQAAGDEEAKVRSRTWRDPNAGSELFGEYANRWYDGLSLAPSTMQNYKHHLEEHLLPEFQHIPIGDISRDDVQTWEERERQLGYKPTSITTWRTTLHTLLADALEEGAIDSNPATRRRGRGRRTGRKRSRGPERVVVDALQALLIAERAAILSGRDEEFILVLLGFYTGMRWGELLGLETRYARLGSIRVEWQLWEADDGSFHRLPPKEDSYRDIDVPNWLSRLVSDHIARTRPQPCDCHKHTYVFRGRSSGAVATMEDVARHANVSKGTVSAVLNHADRVAERTRARVETAMAELQYEPGRAGRPGVHWRRSNFGDFVFEPAASGWFPKRGNLKRRPVPLLAEPWPGDRLRGRMSQERAGVAWLPIAGGLTPHGLRHSHKTLMVWLRTHEILSHERLGHELAGIGGRYTHVTPEMRHELLDQLTREWERSLDLRISMHPQSPVAALDGLLQSHKRGKAKGDFQDRPTDFPHGEVVELRARPQSGA